MPESNLEHKIKECCNIKDDEFIREIGGRVRLYRGKKAGPKKN